DAVLHRKRHDTRGECESNERKRDQELPREMTRGRQIQPPRGDNHVRQQHRRHEEVEERKAACVVLVRLHLVGHGTLRSKLYSRAGLVGSGSIHKSVPEADDGSICRAAIRSLARKRPTWTSTDRVSTSRWYARATA